MDFEKAVSFGIRSIVKTADPRYNVALSGGQLSWLEHCFDIAEVVGSSPIPPTEKKPQFGAFLIINVLFGL